MSNVSPLRPPWKKGQSGNPSGINVPKEAQTHLIEARKLCMENAQAAVAKLVQLLNCGEARIELQAAGEILDRAGMKAVAVDVSTTETDADGNQRTLRVEFVRPSDGPSAVP